MKKVFCRAPYNYDADAASDEAGLRCEDPSLAQQNQREEADINYIVDRALRTGVMPVLEMPPLDGDFAAAETFQDMMNLQRQAYESFAALPPLVRARFQNNPIDFVDFCSNPENLEEMRKMGLAIPKESPRPEAEPKAS